MATEKQMKVLRKIARLVDFECLDWRLIEAMSPASKQLDNVFKTLQGKLEEVQKEIKALRA